MSAEFDPELSSSGDTSPVRLMRYDFDSPSPVPCEVYITHEGQVHCDGERFGEPIEGVAATLIRVFLENPDMDLTETWLHQIAGDTMPPEEAAHYNLSKLINDLRMISTLSFFRSSLKMYDGCSRTGFSKGQNGRFYRLHTLGGTPPAGN